MAAADTELGAVDLGGAHRHDPGAGRRALAAAGHCRPRSASTTTAVRWKVRGADRCRPRARRCRRRSVPRRARPCWRRRADGRRSRPIRCRASSVKVTARPAPSATPRRHGLVDRPTVEDSTLGARRDARRPAQSTASRAAAHGRSPTVRRRSAPAVDRVAARRPRLRADGTTSGRWRIAGPMWVGSLASLPRCR